MALKHFYTLWAPIYDPLVGLATRQARARSLRRLDDPQGQSVLLCGVGTGLDLPHLPAGARYTGIDVTPAMLARARARTRRLPIDIELREGNVMALDLPDACFDTVVMHLILAVVPAPALALREAARVLKPGGQILVLDKFLRPGQAAPLRRLLNLGLRHVATRTDVVFEDLLADVQGLGVIEDEAAFAGGWFRRITLQKRA
jgi:ubiquinone/menaquinone biosynthesis C-methylase UbiE